VAESQMVSLLSVRANMACDFFPAGPATDYLLVLSSLDISVLVAVISPADGTR
jgi:hypothetical protein